MTGCTRGPALRGFHPSLEGLPPFLGDLNLPLGKLARVLPKHVEQDDEVPRAPVEHAVELRAIVAAKLAKFAAHLRAVWERQVRIRRGQEVQPVDLIVDRGLLRWRVQRLDEVVDRLGSIERPVEDGLESRQASTSIVRAQSAGNGTVAPTVARAVGDSAQSVYRANSFARPNGSSKPVRRRSPSLGRFDSCAAPSRRLARRPSLGGLRGCGASRRGTSPERCRTPQHTPERDIIGFRCRCGRRSTSSFPDNGL